jgi:PST family polysaccharide transporter
MPQSTPLEAAIPGGADQGAVVAAIGLATDEQTAARAPDARGTDGASATGMTIGRAAVLGMVTTLGSAALSMSRSKVTAVFLGPAGIGRVAEILQLVTLANTPGALLVGPALLAAVANAARSDDHVAARSVLNTAVLAVAITSTLGCVIATLAGFWVLPAAWGPAAWPLTALGGVATLLAAVAGVPGQALTGYGKLQRLTVINLVVAAIGTAFVSVGTVALGLRGQFVGMVVANVLALPVSFALAAPVLPRGILRLHWGIDRAFLWTAVKVGASAFVAAFVAQSVLTVIRTALEHRGGPALIGQFQAAYGMDTLAFSFMVGALGSYVFPRYAAAPDGAALGAEIEHAMRFVVRVMPPLLLLAIAFREVGIRVLFSHRFDEAAVLLGRLLAVDMLRAAGWILVGPLLLRGHLRAYLASELLAAGTMSGLSQLFIHRYGLNGIAIASPIAHAVSIAVSVIALRVSCDVRFPLRRLLAPLAVAGAAGGALVLEHYAPLPVKAGCAAAALVWLHRVGLLARVFAKLRAVLRGG